MRLIPLFCLLACLVLVQAAVKKSDPQIKTLASSKENNTKAKNEELHINWTFLDIVNKKNNNTPEKKALEKVVKDGVTVVKDILQDSSNQKTVADTNKLLEDSLDLLDKIPTENIVKQRLLAAKGRVKARFDAEKSGEQ